MEEKTANLTIINDNGKFYFKVYGCVFGPYETEAEAKDIGFGNAFSGKGWIQKNANKSPKFFRYTLCPVCGEDVDITGYTKDGRLIGSCGDAFTQEQWDSK